MLCPCLAVGKILEQEAKARRVLVGGVEQDYQIARRLLPCYPLISLTYDRSKGHMFASGISSMLIPFILHYHSERRKIMQADWKDRNAASMLSGGHIFPIH